MQETYIDYIRRTIIDIVTEADEEKLKYFYTVVMELMSITSENEKSLNRAI